MLTLYEAIKAIVNDPTLKYSCRLENGRRYLLYADTEVVLSDCEHEDMDARLDLNFPVVCMASNAFSDKTTALLINQSIEKLWFYAHDPLDTLEFIKEWTVTNWLDRETEYDLIPRLDNNTLGGYGVGDMIFFEDPQMPGTLKLFKLHLISESDRTLYVTPRARTLKDDSVTLGSDLPRLDPSKKSVPSLKMHDATPIVKLFNLISPIYEIAWIDCNQSWAKAGACLRALRRFEGSPSYLQYVETVIGKPNADALLKAKTLDDVDSTDIFNVYKYLLSTLIGQAGKDERLTIETDGYFHFNARKVAADIVSPGSLPLYRTAYSLFEALGVEDQHLVKMPEDYQSPTIKERKRA